MAMELPAVDWHGWLSRWDRQQSGYLPDREQRFTVMLDVLEALLPPAFVALDLACGPGSISQRLLARFSRAHAIAVDLDPVLLSLGQGALGTVDGRLRWVEADLRMADWASALGEQQVDAVLSTTALHWLSADQLVRLYGELGALMRPGGVFLNGDHLGFAPHLPAFRRVADAVRARIEAGAFTRPDAENWQRWWEALGREPAMAELMAERKRRFAHHPEEEVLPIVDLHAAALRNAGFREVGVIWQHLDNQVVMAVR